MATGEMSIRYHDYASKKAANALESCYISKRERYNTIAANINYARYLGATYPCTYLATQDMSRNSSAVNKKSECASAFASAIEIFMESVENTDCEVAILFGKTYGYGMNEIIEHVVDGLDYPELVKIAIEKSDKLPAGMGGFIKYFLSGKYDDKSTFKAFVSFYAKVLTEYEDVILPKKGNVFKSIGNAASAIFHNWDEYANGEIGIDRMIVESSSEAIFDIYKDALLEGAFMAALGPAGLIAAPVASWGLDVISKSINGKGFAENVGDLAGEVYDLVAPVIGDGLEAAGNVIDDGLNIISDGLDIISDGFYVVSSSVASWWPW